MSRKKQRGLTYGQRQAMKGSQKPQRTVVIPTEDETKSRRVAKHVTRGWGLEAFDETTNCFVHAEFGTARHLGLGDDPVWALSWLDLDETLTQQTIFTTEDGLIDAMRAIAPIRQWVVLYRLRVMTPDEIAERDREKAEEKAARLAKRQKATA